MKKLLSKYCRYNLWANKKVCEFLLTLTDEQLNREVLSSFPSLQKTVLHSWDAQFIWIERLNGRSLTGFPSKSFSGTFEDATKGLLESSQQLIDFVETSNESFLKTPLTYKNIAGEEFKNSVCDIIQHIVNHGTFHRGQKITMLRHLGFTKLFSTDYIAFCREY
jgi:uncharacterized damage-inducible protein DinB